MKELVRDLHGRRGSSPVFTWLLRVDEQVREVHGSYNWVLSAHRQFLADLEDGGEVHGGGQDSDCL